MRNVLALAISLGHLFSGAYPGDEEVVGSLRTHVVENRESLMEIGRKYDVGYDQMAAANPGVDPYVPGHGKVVTVPTSWVVPEVAPGTMTINLSELRLYYRMDAGGLQSLVTFPVGIGDQGSETPLGTYRVLEKEVHPTWYVPPSIQAQRPGLRTVVPPGPDNPLGTHALRLSSRGILIHGTNKPWGVGRHVSHGCIRLYPEDIPVLFGLVPVGTRVKVVREPVKVGVAGGRVYLQVYADDAFHLDYATTAESLISARGLQDSVDPLKVQAALSSRTGLPTDVSRREQVTSSDPSRRPW